MIRHGTNHGGRFNFRGINQSSPAMLGSRRRLTCSAAGFNHYAVLGLSPLASKADVKYAYKRLTLKYHPDVARGEICSGKTETFREIKAAYESIMQRLLEEEEEEEEEEETRSINSIDDEWDEWDEWMGCEGGIPTPTFTTFLAQISPPSKLCHNQFQPSPSIIPM